MSITVIVINFEVLRRPVTDTPIIGKANIVDYRFGDAPTPQVEYLTTRWMTTNELRSDTNFSRLIRYYIMT
jgi:hypothetical protein